MTFCRTKEYNSELYHKFCFAQKKQWSFTLHATSGANLGCLQKLLFKLKGLKRRILEMGGSDLKKNGIHEFNTAGQMANF